jgi:hypothetical protein
MMRQRSAQKYDDGELGAELDDRGEGGTRVLPVPEQQQPDRGAGERSRRSGTR